MIRIWVVVFLLLGNQLPLAPPIDEILGSNASQHGMSVHSGEHVPRHYVLGPKPKGLQCLSSLLKYYNPQAFLYVLRSEWHSMLVVQRLASDDQHVYTLQAVSHRNRPNLNSKLSQLISALSYRIVNGPVGPEPLDLRSRWEKRHFHSVY